MKISTVQFNPIFGDKKQNIEKIVKYSEELDSDIIVFPELATSGYDFKSREEVASYAEKFSGDTVSKIAEIAKRLNKIICFGFVEKDGDKLYNSAACLFPDEKLNNVYRKTHLFFRETIYFDRTDKGFFVINDKENDINIGLMICYDWRFPEATRTLGLLGADLILCPSNLVTDVWNISMPSRALENKVYLAVANRTGIEHRNEAELIFKGRSAIYSYNGSMLAVASAENEEVITSEIFPEQTRKKSFNEINDIFKDRQKQWYLS